jgi:tetratricopeptide (TPR) repeat protein
MTIRLLYQWMLLAAVVLGVYYPAIFGGLSPVDDPTRLDRLLNIETFDFFGLFFRSGGYYYRPIVAATFYLDQILWGADALFMHVENLFIHLLNASLVFALARRLCRQAAHLPLWLPLLMAFLFALHPVNAEAVCWISGRYDLLATTFVLGSVWALLWALSGNSTLRILPALMFALLGCLAKETALFYFGGAVCILYVHARLRADTFARTIKLALPGVFLWCAGAMVYLIIRNLALSGRDTGVKMVSKAVGTTTGVVDWADQLRIAVKVSGFYFKKIFIPYPLNFAIVEISHIYLLVGVFFVIICLWLVWRSDLSAAFFLGSILTCSAALLVVFGKMAWTPVAERYLYMPTALFVLGWTAWAAASQKPKYIFAFKALMICCVILWLGMTSQRAKLWSDPVALAEDTVEKSPDFLPARKDLANYYLVLGEKEKGQRLLESVMQTAGIGNFAVADFSMANALIEEGQLDEAHRILSTTLKTPGKQFVKLANALIILNHKRLANAPDMQAKEDIYRENVMLLERLTQRSSDPFIDYRLAKEYLALGDHERARSLFGSVYRRAPASAYYREPARKLAERLTVEQHD